MSGPLGRKVTPQPPAKQPEWHAVPNKPHLEVNSKGQLRTSIDPTTGQPIKPLVISDHRDLDVC